MIVEYYDERGKNIDGNPWIKSKFGKHFIMFNPTYLFESSGYTFYKSHALFYRVK
jgi:hypothetical protein